MKTETLTGLTGLDQGQFMHRRPLNRRVNEFVTSGRTYDTDAANAPGPVILIVSNGSRWMGEEPADFAELLEVLRATPLRPDFGGDFTDKNPISCTDGKPLLPQGWLWVHGNFHLISHVFHVVTNDPEAMQELTDAINANLASVEYKAARTEHLKRQLELARTPKGRRAAL